MLLNQGNGRQTVRLAKRQSSKLSRIFVTLQSGGCSYPYCRWRVEGLSRYENAESGTSEEIRDPFI